MGFFYTAYGALVVLPFVTVSKECFLCCLSTDGTGVSICACGGTTGSGGYFTLVPCVTCSRDFLLFRDNLTTLGVGTLFTCGDTSLGTSRSLSLADNCLVGVLAFGSIGLIGLYGFAR